VADSSGGGLLLISDAWYSKCKITNSIIWNNLPQEIRFSQGANFSAMSVAYSDIKGGPGYIPTTGQDTIIWQEGNIDMDPQFRASGEYPYALQPDSPCLNTGTPDTSGLKLPQADLAGEPRIWGGRVDMGAYEWNNVGLADLRKRNNELRIECYPNPSSAMVTLSYELKQPSNVTLQIFNGFGLMVSQPVIGFRPAGTQRVEWDATNLPAGVYFYRLNAENKSGTGKIIRL
jgi:hypothetical protein